MAIRDIVVRSTQAHAKLAGADDLLGRAERACDTIVQALSTEHKVLLCGNGGSAADAQHMAAELVGRFKRERKALAAIALTTNASVLTSLGNDYSFKKVFARQVEALGVSGDVLIAISTSGESENVVCATEAARRLSIATIAMTGSTRGTLARHADILLNVPTDDTPQIQEAHITLIHAICEEVERRMSA